MWTIVQFEADNTIEAIPTYWLNKDKTKCAWPNNYSTVDKLRNYRTKPNELEFSYFNCRVLTNNIDSLADATNKIASLAYNYLHTSDLSDIDEKKIKTNHISERKRKVISLLKNSFEQPDLKKGKKGKKDSENVTFTAASSKLNQHVTSSTSNVTQYGSPLTNLENNLSFQKLIVKHLTCLKVEVSNIYNTQQEIIKMVNDIQGLMTTQTDDPWVHDIDYFVSSWPISSQDSLNDMENKINLNSNFRKKVVVELEQIQGESLQEMIKKIFKKVFNDSILLEFTYYGLRKKKNFSLLAINKLIIETVFKSKFKNCLNEDIITAISKWLNGAKRRITKKKN